MTISDDARALSNQFDRECVSLPDQAQICLAVGAAALQGMPSGERRKYLTAHLRAIAQTFGTDFMAALDGAEVYGQ